MHAAGASAMSAMSADSDPRTTLRDLTCLLLLSYETVIAGGERGRVGESAKYRARSGECRERERFSAWDATRLDMRRTAGFARSR